MVGYFVEVGKIIYEWSQSDGTFIDFFAAIGEKSWEYFFGDIQLCSDYSDGEPLCNDCYELVESRVKEYEHEYELANKGTTEIVGTPEQQRFLETGADFFGVGCSVAILFACFGVIRFLVWTAKQTYNLVRVIF